MAAYVIVNLDITDPIRFQDYVKEVPATIAAFGGRYLARGGKAEALEGDYRPNRMVLLEFESVERARAWWASEAYRGPKALRQASATTDLILVEGV